MSRPGLLDLLFPPRCVICRALVGIGEQICPDCARELSPTGSQCEQHGDFFDACFSPFFYEEPLRASFLRYKFQGLTGYCKPYGKWMADCLVREDETRFDFITWAPLSLRRRLKRGYDQAELLAREVGKHLELPVQSTLKKAHRKPLSRLEGGKAVRSAQVLGAYSMRKDADVVGKHILLVDDVITTGSTLSECARMLKTAGAERVICVTLARRRKE